MKTVTAKKRAKSADVPTKLDTATPTDVRVVKTARCPSLSGKSDLAYEFGVTDDGALLLRITGNTGKGAFCTDWIDMTAVRTAIERPAKGETITSDVLMPLYRARSANMPGFVFAVLTREGVVRPSEKKRRRYDRAEPSAIDAILRSLAEGKGATPTVDKKSPAVKGQKVAATKSKKANKSAKVS